MTRVFTRRIKHTLVAIGAGFLIVGTVDAAAIFFHDLSWIVTLCWSAGSVVADVTLVRGAVLAPPILFQNLCFGTTGCSTLLTITDWHGI